MRFSAILLLCLTCLSHGQTYRVASGSAGHYYDESCRIPASDFMSNTVWYTFRHDPAQFSAWSVPDFSLTRVDGWQTNATARPTWSAPGYLIFDGVNDCLFTGTNVNLDAAITIVAWVWFDDITHNSYCVCGAVEPSSASDYWMLVHRADHGGMCLQIQTSVFQFLASSQSISAGAWHHLVLTKAAGGGNIQLWQDGVLVVNTPYTSGNTSQKLMVGCWGLPIANYLKGREAGFRVYTFGPWTGAAVTNDQRRTCGKLGVTPL